MQTSVLVSAVGRVMSAQRMLNATVPVASAQSPGTSGMAPGVMAARVSLESARKQRLVCVTQCSNVQGNEHKRSICCMACHSDRHSVTLQPSTRLHVQDDYAIIQQCWDISLSVCNRLLGSTQ